MHPLSGPPFSEALCSLLWVGVPRPWGLSRRTGLGGGHTGPWAPDETAWSLSPLRQAGWPPQGQCVGLGLGVCRRTDYKGLGGPLQNVRAWGTTAEATGRQVRH